MNDSNIQILESEPEMSGLLLELQVFGHCKLCQAEIWKQHKEFPYYWISNLGRIKTVTAKGTTRIKISEVTNRGYERTQFCTNGIKKRYSIHRLVAEYFLDTQVSDTVNHKDFNKLNNKVCNLEWLTHLENIQHSDLAGRRFKKPIIQLSLSGEVIRKWACAYEVEKSIGYKSTNIRDVALVKRKHIKNLNGNSIMEKYKYALFPTLIDSFYWYKRGYNEKQELIDKINRVKTEMPEAAKKGVEFEGVINTLLKGKCHPLLMDVEYYQTENFVFKTEIVNRIAQKLINAEKQQEYIEAIVQTTVGGIKVYGFIDYSYPDMFVDLKTTGSYKKDKYKINNQHKCYPLLAQINGRDIKKFNYLVTDFQQMYIEPYNHNSSMTDEFIFNLVEFTEFLEVHRGLITDKKIFNIK